MSKNINIRVIKKQNASERLRAIFATRYMAFKMIKGILTILILLLISSMFLNAQSDSIDCEYGALLNPELKAKSSITISELEEILNSIDLKKKYRKKDIYLNIYFIVDCNGQTTNFMFGRYENYPYNLYKLRDKKLILELENIIETSIKWTPGQDKGEEVCSSIFFDLEIENGNIQIMKE